MMINKVEEYFPEILKLTEEMFKEEIEGGGIPKEYKGYISTFGAMILQNGILPAVAFFEKEDRATKENREKIIKIIKKYLIEKDERFKNNSNEDKLSILILKIIYIKQDKTYDKNRLKLIENKIINLSIALKLALRIHLKIDNRKEVRSC